VLQVGKAFLEQEQEHADGLAQAIKDAGGMPNRPKPSYDFPTLRSQNDVLRFAVDLEYTAIAAYIDALPKLSQGDLRATAAAIVTNEAEHVAVLLGALGKNQVPDAFVTGRAA
jgi:rubrerythrin